MTYPTVPQFPKFNAQNQIQEAVGPSKAYDDINVYSFRPDMIISEHVRGKAFLKDNNRLYSRNRLNRAISIDDPTKISNITTFVDNQRSASFPFINNIPNFYRNTLLQKYHTSANRPYNLTTRVLETNNFAQRFNRENQINRPTSTIQGELSLNF